MSRSEIWRDIKGYEGMYQVSNKGRVRSLTRKVETRDGRTVTRKGIIRKCAVDGGGYMNVPLCRGGKMKNKTVHRLIATAFIQNQENKPQVNHRDGNKLNNDVENLEWVTASENQEHAYETGLNPWTKERKLKISGENNPASTLQDDDVLSIRKMYKSGGYSQSELANQFNIDQPLVSRIVNRQRWNHI